MQACMESPLLTRLQVFKYALSNIFAAGVL